MPVSLNATAAAASGWFDQPVGDRLLAVAEAQRDDTALAMTADSVRGLGPGSQNTLAEAIDKNAPTVRDYLAFMDQPTAAADLQAAAARRRVGGNVVGIMFARFHAFQADGLDG